MLSSIELGETTLHCRWMIAAISGAGNTQTQSQKLNAQEWLWNYCVLHVYIMQTFRRIHTYDVIHIQIPIYESQKDGIITIILNVTVHTCKWYLPKNTHIQFTHQTYAKNYTKYYIVMPYSTIQRTIVHEISSNTCPPFIKYTNVYTYLKKTRCTLCRLIRSHSWPRRWITKAVCRSHRRRTTNLVKYMHANLDYNSAMRTLLLWLQIMHTCTHGTYYSILCNYRFS